LVLLVKSLWVKSKWVKSMCMKSFRVKKIWGKSFWVKNHWGKIWDAGFFPPFSGYFVGHLTFQAAMLSGSILIQRGASSEGQGAILECLSQGHMMAG